MNQIVSCEHLFPYAQDKAIVDFVQGIDVTRHHIHTMKNRSGLKERFLDGLSGKTYLRNVQNQQNLANGLEGCRQWLTEITANATEHATAIHRLQGLFSTYQDQFNQFVDWSKDFKLQFIDFKLQIQDSINSLDHRVSRIERNQQVDQLISQWQAGGLDGLAPLQKAYMVVENLSWGTFGGFDHSQLHDSEFKNTYAENIQYLKNKLIVCLKTELSQVSINKPILRQNWLQLSGQQQTNEQNILQYMGDWSWENPQNSSTVFLATQTHYLSPEEQAAHQYTSFAIAPIEKVVNLLTHEILKVN